MDFLTSIIEQFSRLPGLGKRGATRIVYDLLKREAYVSRELGMSLLELKEKILRCQTCRNYTDISPCAICQDNQRDPYLLCVVENPQEVYTINATKEYKGYFFVLHGLLSPLDGIGPKHLGLNDLSNLVKERQVKEIILATSSNPEGEATAIYIKQLLNSPQLILTRLASGLPVGGSLDSADPLTMLRSLQGRTPL